MTQWGTVLQRHSSEDLACASTAPLEGAEVGPPGSDQQEPVRCLQTCQGWCESLSLLGIREMGWAEGGLVYENGLFCLFSHVSWWGDGLTKLLSLR